jgi:carbonic anhydrase
MSATDDIVASNKQYVASRKAEQLPLPPSKRVAVLTCMDARILPEGRSYIETTCTCRTAIDTS